MLIDAKGETERKMNLYFAAIFYMTGLVAAQEFAVSPTGPIGEGDTVNVTCDTGTNGVPPLVEANGIGINLITPSGTPNNIAVYQSDPATRQTDGASFTCKSSANNMAISGSPITLVVHFEPVISDLVSLVRVNEGENATINFTVDANPQVMANNVSVTSQSQANAMITIVSDIVFITLPRVTGNNAESYNVTVRNLVGSANGTFQLDVVLTPTSTSANSVSSTETTTNTPSTTTAGSTSSIAPSTTARMMATSMTSPTPTSDTRGSGTSVIASFVTVLCLMFLSFFLFNLF